MLLVGCAIKPVPFTGPNGRQAYMMECGGVERPLVKCYQAAASLCPSGYALVDQRSTSTVGGYGGTVGTSTRHTLAVECK